MVTSTHFPPWLPYYHITIFTHSLWAQWAQWTLGSSRAGAGWWPVQPLQAALSRAVSGTSVPSRHQTQQHLNSNNHYHNIAQAGVAHCSQYRPRPRCHHSQCVVITFGAVTREHLGDTKLVFFRRPSRCGLGGKVSWRDLTDIQLSDLKIIPNHEHTAQGKLKNSTNRYMCVYASDIKFDLILSIV